MGQDFEVEVLSRARVEGLSLGAQEAWAHALKSLHLKRAVVLGYVGKMGLNIRNTAWEYVML